MNFDRSLHRALVVRALAIAMPWYLDFLAVWMLNYECRRIEAMIREMCEAITDLAKWSVRKPQPVVKAFSYDDPFASYLNAFGSVMSGMAAKKAAQQSAYQNVAGLSGNFDQRRSALGNLYGNMFEPIP